MAVPDGVTGVSPCSPDCPSSRSSLVLLALPAGGRRVEQPEHDLRGAARAARPLDARPRARRDPAPSASTACACSSTGATTRRPRTRKSSPAFDATDPAAYPAGDVGRASTRLFADAAARGDRGPAHAHRPGAEVGDGGEEGQRHPAEPEGVPGVRDRRRAPLRRPGRRCGRSGTSPTTRSSSSRSSCTSKAKSPAHLPPALPRRPARPPRVRQRRRHAALRRDRAARHTARRRAARLPARRAVPESLLPPQGPLRARLDADGYAHHAYTTRTGPRFRPPDKDDVTIGVLSRLTNALDQGRPGGRDPRGAAAST